MVNMNAEFVGFFNVGSIFLYYNEPYIYCLSLKDHNGYST